MTKPLTPRRQVALATAIALTIAAAAAPREASAGPSLRPTGKASRDTQMLLDAIAAAPPGGTIVLGAASAAGKPTAWKIGAPGNDSVAIDYGGVGTMEFQDFFAFHLPTPLRSRNFFIDKPLTIRGAVDARGRPLTTITEEGWQALLHDLGDSRRATMFLAHRGARVRFESIRFYRCFAPLVFHAPFELVNCEFDEVQYPFWVMMDPRAIYPHYGESPLAGDAAFAEPRRSLVRGCVFKKFIHAAHMIGMSALTLEECVVGPADCLDPANMDFFWAPDDFLGFFSGSHFMLWFNGLPLEVASPAVVRDNVIRNNVFTNLGGNTAFGLELVKMGPSEGVVEKNEVYGNVFEDMDLDPDGLGLELGFNPEVVGVYAGYDPDLGLVGAMRENSFHDNVVRRAGSNTAAFEEYSNASDVVPVERSSYARNVFESFEPGALYGIGLWGSLGARVVSNDFRASGMPALADVADPREAPIFLFQCTSCFVSEAGCFPPGNGGPARFIGDFEGTDNRIVGGRE